VDETVITNFKVH